MTKMLAQVIGVNGNMVTARFSGKDYLDPSRGEPPAALLSGMRGL